MLPRIEEIESPSLLANLGDINFLIENEAHLEYANFKPIADREGSIHHLHATRWADTNEHIKTWIAHDDKAGPVAALRAQTRSFESDHFGRRMAQIVPPLATSNPDLRLTALSELYRCAFDSLSRAGFQHTAVRASTRDRATCWAVQTGDAKHVDTQVSWMCPLSGTPHEEALPGKLSFGVYEAEGLKQLPEQSWRRLASWGGTAFDRGPLVFDAGLNLERAKEVYATWTNRALTGDWADAAIVVWDDDEIVAFISMKHLRDVSAAANTSVCGQGLGATLPEYRGLFTAIQREMIATRPLGAAFMENETQVATIGSINVYSKLGFRYLRSTCTFHKHLAAI